jgi:hypothetical protein
MQRHLRLLAKLIEEDRILVQEFFQQLGQEIPLWLVPRFLETVAGDACLQDLAMTLRVACTVDPNGNGPPFGYR